MDLPDHLGPPAMQGLSSCPFASYLVTLNIESVALVRVQTPFGL